MEQNQYQTRPRSGKKIRKVTLAAAAVLCVVCFILGIIVSSAVSSGKVAKAKKDVESLTLKVEMLETQEDKLIAEQKAEIDRLTKANADLTEAVNQSKIQQTEEAPVEEDAAVVEEAPATETAEDEAPVEETTSPFKVILTCILVLIIIVCIVFAVVIFLRRGNREDDDEYDDEDYEDDEYDDEYEDDEEEYEDDDYIGDEE